MSTLATTEVTLRIPLKV